MTTRKPGKKPRNTGRSNPAKRATLKRDLILERRRSAWGLRLEGLDYREIGEKLNIPLSTVFSDLEPARKELCQDTLEFAAEERAIELAKLKRVGRKLLERFDAAELPKDLVDLSNAYMRVCERKCKILGIDAPTVSKSELTGKDGAPLNGTGEDWAERLIALGWTPPKGRGKEILPGLPMPGSTSDEEPVAEIETIEVEE